MIRNKALSRLEACRPALAPSSQRVSRRRAGVASYATGAPSLDPKFFRVSEEVRDAVLMGKPVVSLETTIYTHGFPHPDNVALASRLEEVVRENGGVPATIGILRGKAIVGLSPDEIVDLASSAGEATTAKISRRDLPYYTGLSLAGRIFNGGTTIAGTMMLSRMAGIDIFGTGGLGGVHRGAESTMDISADLTELGRTPVAVFSSGCKSFLDIPRTLEYLETQGVGVSTFRDGRSGDIDFPAFWTRESGVRSPSIVNDENEAAAIIYANLSIPLEMRSGLLFANPIPSEYSIPLPEITGAIEAAVKEAAEKGIHGHRNTPFILAKIKELTKGSSIPANKALVESNVKRATKTAVILEELKRGGKGYNIQFSGLKNSTYSKVDVLVAGSIAVDLSCDYAPVSASPKSRAPALYTSNPAVITQTIGGVGHNVATAAHLAIGSAGSIRLCSIVADDLAGKAVISSLEARGMDTSGIQVLREQTAYRTAQYVAVNATSKDLHLAMADMDVMYAFSPSSPLSATHDFARTIPPLLAASSPRWLVVDANWDPATLHRWLHEARRLLPDVQIAFEPVSNEKAQRLFPRAVDPGPAPSSAVVDLATPNIHELAALHDAWTTSPRGKLAPAADATLAASLAAIPDSALLAAIPPRLHASLTITTLRQIVDLAPSIPRLLTKLGSDGVLAAELTPAAAAGAPSASASSTYAEITVPLSAPPFRAVLSLRHMPTPTTVAAADVVSVNGVGDTFLGVLVAGLARAETRARGALPREMLDAAQRAAALTLQSAESVSPAVGGGGAGWE